MRAVGVQKRPEPREVDGERFGRSLVQKGVVQRDKEYKRGIYNNKNWYI